MRRLDIGIASYRNPEKLRATLNSVRRQSMTDWRVFLVHNPSDGPEDAAARNVIQDFSTADRRFVPVWMETNRGYAGAINELFQCSETEYVGYLDNDVEILTPAWDEILCSHLDRFHEIGMMFPNGGAYPINRGNYDEIMWGVGFAFVLNRMAMKDTGLFDHQIGHQNECDYCLRLRMAGWKCASARDVNIAHHASSSNDPASVERINRGVVQFVNKWTAYFGGKTLNYHSPNVLRWHDWHPNALYLEEYFKLNGIGTLNSNPEVVEIRGERFDLLKVPRLSGFYGGRVI